MSVTCRSKSTFSAFLRGATTSRFRCGYAAPWDMTPVLSWWHSAARPRPKHGHVILFAARPRCDALPGGSGTTVDFRRYLARAAAQGNEAAAPCIEFGQVRTFQKCSPPRIAAIGGRRAGPFPLLFPANRPPPLVV